MGGSLLYDELEKMILLHGLDIHKHLKNFVETGTYKGTTTIEMAKYYKNVYTTEIHPGLQSEAIQTAGKSNHSNIKFLLGDSLDLLPEIVPQVTDGCVFFLDAHISGRDSSWNKKDHVPLLKELEIVLSTKIAPSVFILDDVRFWNGETQSAPDWRHVSTDSVREVFSHHDVKIHTSLIQNDRFWVFTDEKN